MVILLVRIQLSSFGVNIGLALEKRFHGEETFAMIGPWGDVPES
jgi:hypothetical protein